MQMVAEAVLSWARYQCQLNGDSVGGCGVKFIAIPGTYA